MKKIIIFILIIIPLILFAKTDFKYQMNKPSHLYVGTPFHLSVTFATGLKDSIFVPKIDTLDIFVLRKITKNEQIEDSRKITVFDLEFAPFDTGTYNFPPITFKVKTKKIETYQTPEYKIIIESTIADTTKTIKDIRGPIKLKLSLFEIILPLLVSTLLIFLIVYLIRRKSEKPITERKKKKVIPIYIETLQMIEKLKKKKLLENGKFLDYFFELSYILRYFLEGYYHINAVEMTTFEIKRALPDIKEKSHILSLLNYADKVKFAKFVPTIEDGKNYQEWLEKYVKNIKQIEESKISETTGEKTNV